MPKKHEKTNDYNYNCFNLNQQINFNIAMYLKKPANIQYIYFIYIISFILPAKYLRSN